MLPYTHAFIGIQGPDGGWISNIDRTFTANVSGETANGTWKLRVRDLAQADVGTIDTWSLDLNPQVG